MDIRVKEKKHLREHDFYVRIHCLGFKRLEKKYSIICELKYLCLTLQQRE